MRKKTSIIIVIILVIICSWSKIDRWRVMGKGIRSIKFGSYDVAIETFSEYLKEDESDGRIRSLYRQARCLKNADRLNVDGRYKEALEQFDYIDDIELIPGTVQRRLDKLKEELLDKRALYEEEKANRRILAKEVADKGSKVYDEGTAASAKNKEVPKDKSVFDTILGFIGLNNASKS